MHRHGFNWSVNDFVEPFELIIATSCFLSTPHLLSKARFPLSTRSMIYKVCSTHSFTSLRLARREEETNNPCAQPFCVVDCDVQPEFAVSVSVEHHMMKHRRRSSAFCIEYDFFNCSFCARSNSFLVSLHLKLPTRAVRARRTMCRHERRFRATRRALTTSA